MRKIIERRKIKASFGKNGKGYKTSKISIPMTYFRFLGISEEARECDVTLYENKIEIRRGENNVK